MSQKISIVHTLRGIAALMVAGHHLLHPQLTKIYDPVFAHFTQWGRHGVEIFFVISGFVLPYSMNKAGYIRSDFFWFLLKRAVRILPASYVAILLLLAMYWLPVLLFHKRIEGVPAHIYYFDALISNLTLTAPYFGKGWYNGVFWTLSLEFQFYLFIGLVFPWLASRKIHLFLLASPLLGFLLRESYTVYFFQYASVFNLGIVAYKLHDKSFDLKTAYTQVAFQVLFCYFTLGLLPMAFGLGTFLLISYTQYENKLFNWLGNISYSVYLNHHLAIYVLEAVIKRIVPMENNLPLQLTVALAHLAGILWLGHLTYVYIEKPFLKYSQQIELHKSNNKQVAKQ